VSKISSALRAFFVGIRKLRWWKVFGDEGFGDCRAHDIGFWWIRPVLFGLVPLGLREQ